MFCSILTTSALMLALSGCGKGKSIDGVYHGAPGSPIVITLKDGKANVNVGGESKTLDYKVEGNKITLVDPKEGNAEMTINDDGTLTSPMGTFSRSPQ